MSTKTLKAYKGLPMEGPVAAWYAKITQKDSQRHQWGAEQSAKQIPAGSRVLEVAPGPGYFCIALAKMGDFQITGLDISKSFVEIARKNASKAGVKVDFREGNASDLPFNNETFDFIICQAAFKNFSEPVRAIREMHRVLKPGRKALIIDLRSDASREEINAEVNRMGLNWINALMTRWIFDLILLRSAYSKDQMTAFVSQTPFGTCNIEIDGVGFKAWFEK